MATIADLLDAIKKSPLTRDMNEQELLAVKKNYGNASADVLDSVIAKIESDTKIFEEKEKIAEEEAQKLDDLTMKATEYIKKQKLETERQEKANNMAEVESMLDQLS